MTYKEAITVLSMVNCHTSLAQETIELAIKALEEADKITFKEVVAYECDQKSVERPQGKWIEHWSENLQKMGFRQCSKCKAGYQLYEHGTRKSDLPWIDGQQYTLKRIGKFCPNCGADMRGGKENDRN